MKGKTIKRKLLLKRVTVAHLQDADLDKIKGGVPLSATWKMCDSKECPTKHC